MLDDAIVCETNENKSFIVAINILWFKSSLKAFYKSKEG